MEPIKARFIVNDMVESRSSFSLELIPDRTAPDNDKLYSAYSVSMIRLSPVKKEITDILDVGMKIDVVFTPVVE